MNTVALVGRLTRDVELRTTASGMSVASMRLAVDRAGDKDEDGYKAGFFDVTAFGKTAELAAQYLSKGRQVAITGSLRFHEWEAKDGSGNRSKVEVNANDITFVGSRGDDEGEPRWNDSGQANIPAGASSSTADDFSGGSDDDIPF